MSEVRTLNQIEEALMMNYNLTSPNDRVALASILTGLAQVHIARSLESLDKMDSLVIGTE